MAKLTTNCFWFRTGHGDPYLSKTLPGATGQRSSILNIYIMYRYGVLVNMFVCVYRYSLKIGIYSDGHILMIPMPGLGDIPLSRKRDTDGASHRSSIIL